MTASTTDRRADEALIERDVRRTQDEMGETVHKLEEKLNPRDIARDAIGDDAADTAKEALEIARRNPLPVALIAVGAVWLFATSDAPLIRELRNRLTGRGGKGSGLRPRSAEPAPIGPSPPTGAAYDRRPRTSAR